VTPDERKVVANTVIRPITASDGAAVTQLLVGFGPARTPTAERMDAVLRTFALHAGGVVAGERHAVVAELDGEPVGVCNLEWQRPFWTDELHAWLPDLIVSEAYRGRGIGRSLLADAVAAAAGRNAAQLSLESGPTREAAHALYRASGFTQAGRTYLLRRTDNR
jgi:GNAT superfamily N-acetyltransferase